MVGEGIDNGEFGESERVEGLLEKFAKKEERTGEKEFREAEADYHKTVMDVAILRKKEIEEEEKK